jgi:hypothetical protein
MRCLRPLIRASSLVTGHDKFRAAAGTSIDNACVVVVAEIVQGFKISQDAQTTLTGREVKTNVALLEQPDSLVVAINRCLCPGSVTPIRADNPCRSKIQYHRAGIPRATSDNAKPSRPAWSSRHLRSTRSLSSRDQARYFVISHGSFGDY